MANVTIYTRQMCGYCSAAKNLLSGKGAQFKELDATFKPELKKEMIQKADGARTFPQIFIGDVHIGGCDDLMAMERSGNLDALLKA